MKIVNFLVTIAMIATAIACVRELPRAMDREIAFNEQVRQTHCMHYPEMCKKLAEAK